MIVYRRCSMLDGGWCICDLLASCVERVAEVFDLLDPHRASLPRRLIWSARAARPRESEARATAVLR